MLQSPSLSLGRRSLTPSVMGSWDWKIKTPEALAQPGRREVVCRSKVFAWYTKPTALVFPVSSFCEAVAARSKQRWCCAAVCRPAMPGAGWPDEPVLCAQVMGWALVWLGSANSC